jgi:hypothetical protein
MHGGVLGTQTPQLLLNPSVMPPTLHKRGAIAPRLDDRIDGDG